MNCLTDQEIAFVFAHERRGEIIARQLDHIARCTFCSDRYLDYKLRVLDVVPAENIQPSPTEKILTASLTKPGKSLFHIAYPFYAQARSFVTPYSTLAAANDRPIPKNSVESVGVLATVDRELMVRVLRHPQTNETELYLIAEDELRYRNVLVHVPSLAKNYISDDAGRVFLGNIPLVNMEDLTVEVQSPRATYNLTVPEGPVATILSHSSGQSIRVRCIPEQVDYRLKITLLKNKTLTEFEPSSFRVMLKQADQKPQLSATRDRVSEFRSVVPGSTARLQLFD